MDTCPPAAPAIRVASVPATHVYVRRLAHPAVTCLPDPSGDDLRTPRFLDPDWWREHPDPPDLLHVHFGFEFYAPAQIDALAQVLDGRGIPLVYTVHDLRNPNHASPDLHDAGLEVLLRAADALVTLTPTAAGEVERRSGRRPHILPHPHVAELNVIRGVRRRPANSDTYRLVIHFKSLRPNMVGSELLAAAADVARDVEELQLQVHLHCDVVSPHGQQHDRELVALACDLADERLADLRVHPYLPHDALLELISGADGFVLPYRFGTHSGLLELCRDLGTAVIAPTCGGYADQGAHHCFDASEETEFDAQSFRQTLRDAAAAGPPRPLSPAARAQQRQRVAHAYHELYREVLSSPRRAATRRRGSSHAGSPEAPR